MKEQVVLSYTKGITNSPSDLLCGDGELAECVNLEVKNGELVPMEMPTKLGFSLNSGEKLILVHNTKLNDKYYFTLTDDSTLRVFYVSGTSKKYDGLELDCGKVKSIQALGNSVVVYTSNSVYYILYSEGKYKYLGSKIPEVGLSFELDGDFIVSDKFEFSTPNEEYSSESFQSQVVAQLVGEVNKFIENESIATGRFMYPFFVRYALRLFDGTHVHHSSPVLMLPSTNISPFVSSYSDMQNYGGKTYEAQVGAFVAGLTATVTALEGSLSDWKEIVTGLDIFVSRQIYSYDQEGIKFGNAALSGSKFVGLYDRVSTVWDGYSQMDGNVTIQGGKDEFLTRWYIPSKDAEEFQSEIVNTSLFYKYASLNIEDIVSGDTIDVSGNLASLEVGETLEDDYMTHDVFIPESSFVYNGRLNISNITRHLFDGYPMQCMSPLVKSSTQDGYGYDLSFGRYRVYTYIKSASGGSDIVVQSDLSTSGALYGSYLFYPDSDAYKMVVEDTTNNQYAELSLTEHPLLNGAYAFMGFGTLPFVSGRPGVTATDNKEALLNKLYASSVNNLFHFPLEGMYTVGSDRIIGMAAVTRPISQGQFGEFPLMVFCSDGNYAMRVDAQGFYSSISPIQEDVVLSGDQITPMENSVMVITKKGLMLTTGGEMNRVGIQMDGGFWDILSLDGVKTSVSELSSLITAAADKTGFRSYVYGAKMAFDYASNRLFVYNPGKPYSYVYNFENDTVSKMVLGNGLKIVSSVMDYPDVLVQDENGGLYSLYEKSDISMQTKRMYGAAMTRPLKMGEAMTMKSIKQVMMLVTHGGGDSFAKYLLFGSNDNVNYYKVTSRFGKPYKFYRMALYASLLPKESISGSVITIEKRREHKLRG